MRSANSPCEILEKVTMMKNRVQTVEALPDYRLKIVFRTGECGIFDCKPYRDYECLSGIWNEDVFPRVVADHGTVMWPDGSDLCPDEIYDRAERVVTS